MDLDEWVGKLSHLNHEQILALHFGLQEKIKGHYRLRNEGDNLEKAECLCEQMVALSGLALPALRASHRKAVVEYEKATGVKYPGDFYAPSHYGYSKLITILKRKKDYRRIEELREKISGEGWRY